REQEQGLASEPTQLNLGRSEVTGAAVDEGNVVRTRSKHAAVRNHDLLTHFDSQSDARVHSGLQLQIAIFESDPDPGGSCGRIDLRPDVVDPAGEFPARVGIDGNSRRIADVKTADLILKNRGVGPDRR